MVDTVAFYLRYGLQFRGLSAASGLAAAIVLALLESRWSDVPAGYLIWDGIFTVVLTPMIFSVGWAMVVFHLLSSAAWLATAYVVIAHLTRSGVLP